MKAVLLCGGEGTRLRPYTYRMPKPLLPVGGRPILEYTLLNLKRNGIRDVVLTVGYLHEKIVDYFGDGSRLGMHIEYSIEKERLDTAGSVLQAKDLLGNETFFVGMGDHITAINIDKMLDYHEEKGNIATMAFKLQGIPLEYGVAELEDGVVKAFKEKPILSNYINAGMYIFEPAIFEYIQPKEDFGKHVFPRLLKDGKKISSYVFNEFWADVGRIKDYEEMNNILSIVDLMMTLNGNTRK